MEKQGTQQQQFPTRHVMPKEETQAAQFVSEHPEYDGRGVVVAIFDSGVDPGADGLRITSDGKVKVIDCVDATGSGDIDTSTVVEASAAGTLQGLSGRTLKLGDAIVNPSGKYNVGIIRAYELFPKPLVSRLKEERKKKFDEVQRTELARIKAQIDATTDDKAKKELEVAVEQLKELQGQYDDAGPVYDAVVYHDGAVWRSVIDLEETGDLAAAGVVAFTDYRREHQLGTFGHNSMLNFAVNIYEEGRVLSIVTSGSHGTHVAGIVGANYPETPELNGMAPGVQIVSVKIGDTRLGTMETGTGLVRAAIHAIRSKVDLINMSYGEAVTLPNQGRFIQLAKDLVNKYNITFVSSAGNNGPALSTVGAPGGTTSGLIGVGAYVSGPMMDACYSMREELPETQYTWSSRGPTPDGHQGVSISAPGGAVSPVPNWLLTKSQLMNGTSMSSPNCCGGIALLISALKAQGVKYTPHTIKRAIENSARRVPAIESFALGNGLLQVNEAYHHLLKYGAAYADPAVRFDVDLPLHHHGARGVYLRDWEETNRVLEATVRVTPVFHDDVASKEKIEFERRYALVVSHPQWIEAPKHLILSNGERSFAIKVDPTVLEAGSHHYGEIVAIDVSQPEAGPVFKVPVTVIRPLRIERGPDESNPVHSLEFNGLTFRSGGIERRFVSVPHGASHAVITIRGVKVAPRKRFVLHTLQLTPHRSYAQGEHEKYIWMESNAEEAVPIKVKDGVTIELCLAQYWNGIGDALVDMKVEFHGLKVTTTDVGLYGSHLVKRVDVSSLLRKEDLLPKIVLDRTQRPVTPTTYAIRSLPDDRDRLPEGKQIYEMVLTYGFKLSEAGDVTPRFPVLSTLLYESPYEAQFWMIFNANKRLVGFGDFRPSAQKLAKGSYTLRFQIRHDQVEMLEKLKDTEVLLEKKIAKPLNLPIFSNISDALVNGSKFASAGKKMKCGREQVFFIGRTDTKSLPKDTSAGDLLLGTLQVYKKLFADKNKKLAGLPFAYVVQPTSSCSSASAASSNSNGSNGGDGKEKEKEKEKEQTPEEKLEAFIFEKKVEYADKLLKDKKVQEFDDLSRALVSAKPDHLPLLVLNLKRAVSGKNVTEIAAAADAVVANIDTTSLALHLAATKLGTKPEGSEAQAAAKATKEKEKQLDALLSALTEKTLAVATAALATEDAGGKAALLAEADATLEQLKKWANVTGDSKYYHLLAALHRARGQLATALKYVSKQYKELADGGQLGEQERGLYEQRVELVRQLGWAHWESHLRAAKHALYPAKYSLF